MTSFSKASTHRSTHVRQSLRVRNATRNDFQAMAQLHAANWRLAYRGALSDAYLNGDIEGERLQWWQSLLEKPGERQHILLAEHQDQLAGFACVYGNENEEWGSYLNNIHVAQTAQGLGIGALLLNATASVCKEHYGEAGYYLWVLQSNTKAQGFYARHGGQNTGTDIWNAPGGTTAPLFRFSWPSVSALQAATVQYAVPVEGS
jgi:ribosomal protein S18 acetylase RimI-like enzyme